MGEWVEYGILGAVLVLCLAFVLRRGRKQMSGDGCGGCGCGDANPGCGDKPDRLKSIAAEGPGPS